MNRYYAEIVDITEDDEVVAYGYTFAAKNMREAKLHAMDVCHQMKAIPVPSVWRISLKSHQDMLAKYSLPRAIRFNGEPIDEAA